MKLYLPISSAAALLLIRVLVGMRLRRSEGVIKLLGNNTVPADSIVDTGSNTKLTTPVRSNFPPYGREFKGGMPTGRSSNGKVPADFLDVLFIGGSVKPIQRIQRKSERDCRFTYNDSRIRQAHYDIGTYIDIVVRRAFDYVKAVFGSYPAQHLKVIGDPPKLEHQSSSAIVDSFPYKCNDTYNDLIKNPGKFGFNIVNKGCCGTGLIEASVLCNQFSSYTCSDDSGYLFWDGFHPTEKAYKIVTSEIIQNYINKLLCGDTPC